MRTAVFSGSFNPLHIGHLAILRRLCDSADFDRVLLIVTPQNPLKDSSYLDNSEQRFQDAVETIGKYPELSKVIVDNIELGMEAPHYSIKTLEALKRREPDSNFVQIIGGDNLGCMRKWKDYDRILSEFGVWVYPREGYDSKRLRDELMRESADYKIELADFEEVDASSTQIRDGEALGLDMSGLKI